jgi:DNA polymerase I-like protein with 3'-5' exonuclease and polymerase domains
MPPWAIERSLYVHDEILLETPIEATDEVALALKDTIEEAGRTLLKTL